MCVTVLSTAYYKIRCRVKVCIFIPLLIITIPILLLLTFPIKKTAAQICGSCEVDGTRYRGNSFLKLDKVIIARLMGLVLEVTVSLL